MDSTYNGPATPPAGQSHFFYYNPDPKAYNRQHGHFSPHPNGQTTPLSATFNSTLPRSILHDALYSRPQSAAGLTTAAPAGPLHRSLPPRSAYNPEAVLTPLASPRPLYHKPAVLVHPSHESPYLLPIDPDCTDASFVPSTPPLSCSGSAISSPPSASDYVQTPLLPGVAFSAHERYEVVAKPSHAHHGSSDEDRYSDAVAATHHDWPASGSPPITPGTFPFQPSQT